MTLIKRFLVVLSDLESIKCLVMKIFLQVNLFNEDVLTCRPSDVINTEVDEMNELATVYTFHYLSLT